MVGARVPRTECILRSALQRKEINAEKIFPASAAILTLHEREVFLGGHNRP